MKVTFDPNNQSKVGGVVSFASWENPALQDAIRLAFNESPRERIAEIVIDQQGIKAVFEPSNSVQNTLMAQRANGAAQ